MLRLNANAFDFDLVRFGVYGDNLSRSLLIFTGNYIYGIIKIFVLCRAIGGEFAQNIETTETAYFSAEELPEQLAVEKTSREQALMCLDAAAGRLPGV